MTNGAPSSEHSKVAGSSAEKVKVAVFWSTVPDGPPSIVTTGALRSTISHSNWAGTKLACPRRLMAWTSNVYSPSAEVGVRLAGGARLPRRCPSSSPVQAALEGRAGLVGAELERRAAALVLDVRRRRILVGRARRRSWRPAGRATVQVWPAGETSMTSNWLTARTSSVCAPNGASKAYGVSHELHGAPSSEHSNSESARRRRELELDGRRRRWSTGSSDPGGAWMIVVSGATASETSTTANGDRLLTTPQARSPWSSSVTSTHALPSKCRTCGVGERRRTAGRR